MPPTSRMLKLVSESVRTGKCILFLGAGVHAPPDPDSPFAYPDDRRPPIGSALSRTLAEECDFEERFPNENAGNLQRVALAYELECGREMLVDMIAKAVDVGEPSPMVRALASMDFPIIITTNYDQLMEQALREVGKDPRVTIYSADENAETIDIDDPSPERPVVYKLHGDIRDRVSLVVTDEDYIQFVMRMMTNKERCDPIPLSLKEALTGSTVLLVGYSLLDYNLRLLFKTLRWKLDPANTPVMYSLDFRPDELIEDVWWNQRRYVRFIADDVWSFVPQLYEMVLGEELTP
jgi:hypothetical protein